MRITGYEYNEKLLRKWQGDKGSEEKITKALEEFLSSYNDVLRDKTRVKNFNIYAKGILGNLDRKSIEPIALEYMGTSGVRTLQNFITRSNFNNEEMLREYQSKLGKTITSPNGMLSIDGSSFVKKGKNSVGVQRQYCGRLGKTENCQEVVFAAYAGENGYGLVDRELYIPEKWFNEDYTELRKKCGVSEEKCFKTKNEIALEMIRDIFKNCKLNIKWIGGDAAFGCDHKFVDSLDSLPEDVSYFLGIPKSEQVFLEGEEEAVTVEAIGKNDAFPWEKVGFATSKGVRNSEVKIVRVYNCRDATPNKESWVYIRRFSDGKIKYSTSNAPADTEKSELHEAATLRWPIEQCFEECKSNLGMADFEGRSYRGFMRHLLFVMIVHLFATSLRLSLKKTK